MFLCYTNVTRLIYLCVKFFLPSKWYPPFFYNKHLESFFYHYFKHHFEFVCYVCLFQRRVAWSILLLVNWSLCEACKTHFFKFIYESWSVIHLLSYFLDSSSHGMRRNLFIHPTVQTRSKDRIVRLPVGWVPRLLIFRRIFFWKCR